MTWWRSVPVLIRSGPWGLNEKRHKTLNKKGEMNFEWYNQEVRWAYTV